PGDSVEEDQSVVELETDKASLEVPAPRSGVLEKILKQEGETVAVGEVIGYIKEGNGKPREAKVTGEKSEGAKPRTEKKSPPEPKLKEKSEGPSPPITPSARRALREH